MPTRHEVYLVADRLRAAGARVSIRSVRDALPRGGSPRVVGDHLSHWRLDRAYHPRLEAANLPEWLQNRLADFGKSLLEEAHREATRTFDADRQALERQNAREIARRNEADGAAAVLRTRLAVADERGARLEAELLTADEAAARLRTELTVAHERIRGLSRKQRDLPPDDAARSRRRTEARIFWERVVQEVRQLLASDSAGKMTREQIATALPEQLKVRARTLGEDLGPAMLGKRLDERVLRGRYFRKHDNAYGLDESRKQGNG